MNGVDRCRYTFTEDNKRTNARMIAIVSSVDRTNRQQLKAITKYCSPRWHEYQYIMKKTIIDTIPQHCCVYLVIYNNAILFLFDYKS